MLTLVYTQKCSEQTIQWIWKETGRNIFVHVWFRNTDIYLIYYFSHGLKVRLKHKYGRKNDINIIILIYNVWMPFIDKFILYV